MMTDGNGHSTMASKQKTGPSNQGRNGSEDRARDPTSGLCEGVDPMDELCWVNWRQGAYRGTPEQCSWPRLLFSRERGRKQQLVARFGAVVPIRAMPNWVTNARKQFPNRTGSRQKSVDDEEQFNWEKGRAATGLPTAKIITHNPTFKRDQMFREKKMLEVKNLTKLSSKWKKRKKATKESEPQAKSKRQDGQHPQLGQDAAGRPLNRVIGPWPGQKVLEPGEAGRKTPSKNRKGYLQRSKATNRRIVT